ncbi:MAG: tyrosine recombinase [Eubacterium sp.]|nr:tyrosine recombinase [Eubacterium sp.]
MEIREQISAYIKTLKQRGTAQNTIVSYERDLRQMETYLASAGVFEACQADEMHLRGFLLHMEAEHKRPATIARAAASAKAFFRYLQQTGQVMYDPSQQLKAPKVEKGIPHILTPQEVVRLLQQPNGNTAKVMRDRAMLELLYATGIRVSELIQLQIGDVNLTMEYLVCSQGTKERVIPFGSVARQTLTEYLEKARPQLVKDTDCQQLFTNLSGKKMSRQGFWKLVKQYAQEAGIEGEITPHTLRHSFAAHLVNNGADLYAVGEMMGYADLSAAQVYAKMHRVSVREAYTKAHPRERS